MSARINNLSCDCRHLYRLQEFVEMSLEIQGVLALQRKVCENRVHGPDAVMPWLASEGTTNLRKYPYDVRASSRSRHRDC